MTKIEKFWTGIKLKSLQLNALSKFMFIIIKMTKPP